MSTVAFGTLEAAEGSPRVPGSMKPVPGLSSGRCTGP